MAETETVAARPTDASGDVREAMVEAVLDVWATDARASEEVIVRGTVAAGHPRVGGSDDAH